MTVAPQPDLGASNASAPIAPFSTKKGDESFTIREARRDELDVIAWAAGEAFIDDAVVHYMAGSKKAMSITNEQDVRGVRDFYYFLFKACMIGGGRVLVAVPDLPNDTSTKTTIAAAVAWYPPKSRTKILNALKGGLLKCLRNWGLPSGERMTEFEDSAHDISKKTFKAKAMEVPAQASQKSGSGKGTLLKATDAWYLHIVFTGKQYEGRGLLSTLMREGYAYIQHATPGIPITLESSSAKSRDRYAHLGFELMEPQTLLGVGKVNSLGLAPADKEQARKQRDELKGVPYYNMANWDPSKPVASRKERAAS